MGAITVDKRRHEEQHQSLGKEEVLVFSGSICSSARAISPSPLPRNPQNVLEPGPVHTSQRCHIIPSNSAKTRVKKEERLRGMLKQSLGSAPLCPLAITTPREERLGKVKPNAGVNLKLIWFAQNRSYYPALRISIMS